MLFFRTFGIETVAKASNLKIKNTTNKSEFQMTKEQQQQRKKERNVFTLAHSETDKLAEGNKSTYENEAERERAGARKKLQQMFCHVITSLHSSISEYGGKGVRIYTQGI